MALPFDRRRWSRGFAAAAAFFAALAQPVLANPFFAGADPSAAAIDGEYWIYPTNARRADRLIAWSSPDLAHWRPRGELIDIDDIDWVDDDHAPRHYLWAPSILRSGDRYLLYYSVGPQNPTPSRIGVAVAARPEGPFVDTGKPLLTGGRGFEAIDPMAFVDPRSGVPYLYAGGSAGARLRVFQLKPDLLSIDREIPVETPPNFTEGAFMHERDGVYYLSYSHGSWNHADYSVHYATAPSPTGPWTYRGAILTSDATHQGPGHHSFLRDPRTGEWSIVYHRWEQRPTRRALRGQRRIAIERISYAPDGAIEPVRMTD